MTSPPTRVLVVDDVEENLIAMEALVRRLGVEVSCAASGREALELLLVEDYALALLDVNMPEMDGFQLAELMRGSQRTRSIPIIFVTAAYDPQRVFQGYDAGAVDFLFKPVDPKILQHKISTFIALHDQQRQLSTQLRQLEELSTRLAESLRMHETFVAAVNHDLRTPLHTISMALTLLGEGEPNANRGQLIGRAQSAAGSMGAMLDQLYDVARARLGQGLPLETEPGDLCEIAQRVVHEAEVRSRAGRVLIASQGDGAGTWDLLRISRVVTNLVANALTHGDPAHPVEVRVDGTAPDTVRVVVRNQGTIPADLLPMLFEPFRGGGRQRTGLGLGLYIVREIATAHGGTVDVRSCARTGTEFEVCLPRRPVPAA